MPPPPAEPSPGVEEEALSRAGTAIDRHAAGDGIWQGQESPIIDSCRLVDRRGCAVVERERAIDHCVPDGKLGSGEVSNGVWARHKRGGRAAPPGSSASRSCHSIGAHGDTAMGGEYSICCGPYPSCVVDHGDFWHNTDSGRAQPGLWTHETSALDNMLPVLCSEQGTHVAALCPSVGRLCGAGSGAASYVTHASGGKPGFHWVREGHLPTHACPRGMREAGY